MRMPSNRELSVFAASPLVAAESRQRRRLLRLGVKGRALGEEHLDRAHTAQFVERAGPGGCAL